MSLPSTLLLGLVAGVTIVLGLPLGRMRSPAPGLGVFLNATAVGVLLFLFWDVLSAAWEPVDAALAGVHDGSGGLGSLFAAGLAVGLLALVGYDRSVVAAGRARGRGGPGGDVGQRAARPGSRVAAWPAARRLALLIAVGIGLHNFAEGLAIGQAAARNAIALATVLVIGFALHNATEGFGILAPLAADRDVDGVDTRPGWGFLLAMAAIGGGPPSSAPRSGIRPPPSRSASRS